MTQHLVLSEAEAEAVRGDSSPGHSLNPLPLTDGRYVLPVRVLEAPEHAIRRDYLMAHGTVEDIDPALFLRTLPVRQVADSDFQWRADAEAEAAPLVPPPTRIS